jgi:hypothetical protein
LVPNALLALCIKVAEIGGGEVLALGEVLLLPLPLGTDTIDNFLGILSNSRVVGVGAFNHMDPIFEERPWMGSATAVATKWAFRQTARLVRAIIVTVLGDVLGSTSVDLS